MPVVDARGFNLTPDIGGQLSTGLNLLGGVRKIQSQDRNIANQEQLKLLSGQVLAGGEGSEAAQQQLQTQFPQESLKLDKLISEKAKAVFDAQDADTQGQLKNFSQRSAFALTLPQDKQLSFLENEVSQGVAAGKDMSDTQEIIDTYKVDPVSGQKQLQQSARFGEQLGFLEPVKTTQDGQIEISEVQSSKILPGGLVQIVRKDGTVETIPAAEADAELVKQAERRGAELQGIRASEREGAKGAQKVALNAFDQVGKIRQNITDLQEGIRLVRDEGAETGPIADRVASFRAGTVKLNQLRSRLGLNVVGSVTFGALSEGELALAKDVALPRGLNETEIIDWMENRISAQQKLATNMEEAAIFLSEPGNSVADFIKFTKERDAVAKEAQKQKETVDQQESVVTQPVKVGRFQVEVVE